MTVQHSPPKPRLVFRVGVVGHRPNRMPSADLVLLKERLLEILGTVRRETVAFADSHGHWFAGEPPVLRALSPLAEGADRCFGEAALDLKYELCCTMPFPHFEYEKDFAPGKSEEPEPGSAERFRSLLARARKETKLVQFELDGVREREAEAYGFCGRVALQQSDLLVAVWDGRRTGKRGGTEEILDEAQQAGVPVVLIDAAAPHGWKLLDGSTGLGIFAADSDRDQNIVRLRETVRGLLELPKVREGESRPSRDDARRSIEEFLKEKKPRLTCAVIWPFFKKLVGHWKVTIPNMIVPDFEKAVEEAWPRDHSTPTARMIDRLRPFYAWPDKLAVLYSDVYRSVFIFAFLASALAVNIALLPVMMGWDKGATHTEEWLENGCIVFEVVLIFSILGLVSWGRRRGWHERWMNYRITAELIRHVRLLAPLGGHRSFPQQSGHLAGYGSPNATWMAWYATAVERDEGLSSMVVDKAHVIHCLAELEILLNSQIAFHQQSAKLSHHIETRLQRLGLILLGLTLAACFLHLLHRWMELDLHTIEWLDPMLAFLCAFFPALTAALAGIENQGEFRRVVRRSEAMTFELQMLLESVKKMIEQLRRPEGLHGRQPSEAAAELMSEAARLMINEVLDWRVIFADRPLIAPT